LGFTFGIMLPVSNHWNQVQGTDWWLPDGNHQRTPQDHAHVGRTSG